MCSLQQTLAEVRPIRRISSAPYKRHVHQVDIYVMYEMESVVFFNPCQTFSALLVFQKDKVHALFFEKGGLLKKGLPLTRSPLSGNRVPLSGNRVPHSGNRVPLSGNGETGDAFFGTV